MTVYSFLLMAALGVSAPWWLWRMATSGRYREGLGERLGFVPAALRAAVAGRRVVWVHAVSVGEVLAAERLIGELRVALPGYVVAVSTTTATGQKIARERLAGCPVFYFPLDFSFAVRRYLRVLRPALVVLVESELWPRLLVECAASRVPVAVVNARVSDRSFPRYMRLRWLWKPLLGKVSLFLAQGEESAARLRRIGAPSERVRVSGNLKWDGSSVESTALTEHLRTLLGDLQLVVAGSTHEGEEAMLAHAWPVVWKKVPSAVLLIAPRHPQRFKEVASLLGHSELPHYRGTMTDVIEIDVLERLEGGEVIMLDTIGDLASMYGIASAAFVGGSLAQKGGQNPLEPARFGVPLVMGPSYENFREIAEKMIAAGSLTITDEAGLAAALVEALKERSSGPQHFEGQTGATRTTVEALIGLVGGGI